MPGYESTNVILRLADLRVELNVGRSTTELQLTPRGGKSYIESLCRIRVTSLCETDRHRGNEKFQTRFMRQPALFLSVSRIYARNLCGLRLPDAKTRWKNSVTTIQSDVSSWTILFLSRLLVPLGLFQLALYTNTRVGYSNVLSEHICVVRSGQLLQLAVQKWRLLAYGSVSGEIFDESFLWKFAS